jgi:kelch-like protein 2/3
LSAYVKTLRLFIFGACVVECCDITSQQWTYLAPMNERRCFFAGCFMKGLMYTVGGTTTGADHLNSVECYDFIKNRWRKLASMNTKRYDQLYAVGGIGESYALDSVERYDPVNNHWSFLAAMNTKRYSHGVGVVQGKLYAVGGTDGELNYTANLKHIRFRTSEKSLRF